jgi:hypothetical protein
MGKRSKRLEQLALVHPNAAGLDIGAREIWACVPADAEQNNVRRSRLLPQTYTVWLTGWVSMASIR